MTFSSTEQELTYSVAVIGLGASGAFAALLLSELYGINVIGFDKKYPFTTLLPTGGGRCNITFNNPDIKEFVKNYPRGEKFLLSLFSVFDSQAALELFKKFGIATYTQNDGRVFPENNSSSATAKILQNKLFNKNFSYVKENVFDINKINGKFLIYTEKSSYKADTVIIATGGKGNGFEFAQKFNHNIIPVKPSLFSLNIKEKFLYELSGMSFKNVEIAFGNKKKKNVCSGDVMFTHKSITGPGIFKLSALNAYTDFNYDSPLVFFLKLSDSPREEIISRLNENKKKSIKNVFSLFAPENYITAVCKEYGIDCTKQAAQIRKDETNILIDSILNLKLNAINKISDSEIVSAGGADLKQINAKTLESKICENLFLIGEILDIDGFTGGFNLQNCWSCAFASTAEIKRRIKV